MIQTASETEIETYLNNKSIYFFENQEEAPKFKREYGNTIKPQGWWEGAKCIGAIALFLGGAGAAIKGVKA